MQRSSSSPRLHLLTLSLVLSLFGLGLSHAQTPPPANFTQVVTDGSESVTVDYVLHPIRSANFSVLVQNATGTFDSHTAADSRIYLGSVVGRPGAIAAGLLKANGTLLTRISFEDGVEWSSTGGNASIRGNNNWQPNWPGLIPAAGGAGNKIYAAEVGVDAPFAQYNAAGQDVDATVEIIEFSIMATNIIYLRDAGILHQVGRIVIRADAAQDPYAPDGGSTNLLLTRVKDEWNNLLPASTHDVALVARPNTGGGLAWVGAIGTGNRYSSNGTDSNGDFTVIWRHEVGHNWGSSHFEGGTPVGPTIMSGNALSRISGSELVKMIAHRDSRLNLFEDLGAYSFAIPPRASVDRASFEVGSGALNLDVLGNDHDANDEALSIIGFDTTTSKGGSITLSNGTGPGGRDELTYTPSPSFLTGFDFFTYRIADTSGAEAIGYVMVRPEFSGDLAAHWTLDDGAGTLAEDSSVQGNDGNVGGGAIWQPSGQVGGALCFDGVDDQVQAGALTGTGNEFTVSGWIQRDGDQIDWAGIAFSRGGGQELGFNFGPNNELRYHWGGGGNPTYNFNSNLVPPDGVWTYCALVISPTSATIYMDDGSGLQSAVATGSFASLDLGAGPYYLGRDPNGGRYFKGCLDDFRVFRRSLSLAEIQSISAGGGTSSNPAPSPGELLTNSSLGDLSWTSPSATTTQQLYFGTDYVSVRDATVASPEYVGTVTGSTWTPPTSSPGTYFWRIDTSDGVTSFPGPVWFYTVEEDLVAGLVAWWKFDDATGSTAVDSSTTGADGTLDSPTWTTGQRDGALDFDGNDRVEFGNAPSLSGNTAFTVSAWINLDSGTNTSGTIIQQRALNGFNGQYRLTTTAAGLLNFYLFGNSAEQFNFSGTTAVNDGQWHHVIATRDEVGNAQIYLDGELEASVTGTIQRDLSGSIDVGIGCDIRDSITYFNGKIDDVRIYSRQLGADERAKLRNQDPFFLSESIVAPAGASEVAYTGSITAEAADPDAGETLSFSLLSGPEWLNVSPAGGLSGTPGDIDAGLNQFLVQVSDSLGGEATAELFIEVVVLNTTPEFNSDPVLVADATQDIAYAANISGAASDVDNGDSLTFSKTAGPAWLIVNPDGSLAGMPTNADVGPNSFGIRVTDTSAATDDATLSITVINVNDPPSFTQSTITGASATQNASYSGSIDGTAVDIDAGDSVTYLKASGPAWLTIAPNGDLSGTPSPGDIGLNTFTVIATDSMSLTDQATLEIQVINVNDPPVFDVDPIPGSDAVEDTVYSGTLAGLVSDSDPGDTQTFLKVSGPAWLTVGTDGQLSGTPENADVGANAFVIRVTDAGSLADEAVLNITVINTNDDPAFLVDPILLAGASEEEAFLGETLAGRASDPDVGDTLTYSKVSGPAWLNVASTGELSGTPPADSAGTNIFVVKATDTSNSEVTASLEIDVAAAELSLPWETAAVGSLGVTGEPSDAAGVFTVEGAGRLIGRNDSFQFVWQTIEGDGTITARVHTLDDTGSDVRVGIMVRDTLGTNSRHVFLGVDGTGAFKWLRRTSPGAMTATSRSGNSSGGDAWLRLARVNGIITASKSLDGVTWTTLGSLSANLPSTCYFGLVAVSGDNAVLNSSKFDQVSVTP